MLSEEAWRVGHPAVIFYTWPLAGIAVLSLATPVGLDTYMMTLNLVFTRLQTLLLRRPAEMRPQLAYTTVGERDRLCAVYRLTEHSLWGHKKHHDTQRLGKAS